MSLNGFGLELEMPKAIAVAAFVVLSGNSSYKPTAFLSTTSAALLSIFVWVSKFAALSTLSKSVLRDGNKSNNLSLLALFLQLDNAPTFNVPSGFNVLARIVRKSVSSALRSWTDPFIAALIRVFRLGTDFINSSFLPYHARIKSMSKTPDCGSTLAWKSFSKVAPMSPSSGTSGLSDRNKLVKDWVTWNLAIPSNCAARINAASPFIMVLAIVSIDILGAPFFFVPKTSPAYARVKTSLKARE